MIRLWIIICASLMAAPGIAQQQIQVRGGEHAGFTRLVLAIAPDWDWALHQDMDMATLRLSGQNVAFDVSNSFARIPRTRVAALRSLNDAGDAVLEIELACACVIATETAQGRYLVLNISEGTTQATSRQAEIRPIRRATRPVRSARAAPGLFRPTRDAVAPDVVDMGLAGLGAPQARADDGAGLVAQISELDTAQPDIVMAEADAALAARLAAAQTALIEQLTRAADQGLIDFAPVDTPPAAPMLAQAAPDPDPDPIPEPESVAPNISRQISATTVVDRDSRSALVDIVTAFARQNCLDDAAFDLAAWSQGDFASGLAQLHQDMVDARDRPNTEAVIALTKFYIAHGFGREARTVLGSFDLAAQVPILAELSSVVDNETVSSAGLLHKGGGCGGAHEMWRLVAFPTEPNDSLVAAASILDAFAQQPIDLRLRILAPLGHALIHRGRADLAARIVTLAERAGQALPDDARLLQAELLWPHAPEHSIEIANDLIAKNAANAPQALLFLSDVQRQNGGAMAPEIVESLAAAATEWRDTDLGRHLRVAELLGRATVDGTDVALTMIREDLRGDPMAQDLYDTAAELLELAAPDPDNPSIYAATVLQYADLIAAGAAGDALRTHLADQLLTVGLPDMALQILADATARDAAAQTTAARAYNARFQPETALQILDGQDNPDALRVRAAAFAQLGDHVAALSALAAADAAQTALAQSAFLAGDWTTAQQAPDGAQAVLASYMAARAGGTDSAEMAETTEPEQAFLHPTPVVQPNTLEAARATLLANRSSRTYLESLLNGDNL